MESYNSLNEIQLSVLSEIGNIGAGNAATSLSSILSDKVMMSVPDLQIVDVEKMASVLGGPENEVAALLINMTDDVEGMLLFILEKDFVSMLVSVLLSKNIDDFSNISDMDMSAIMEIGNILAGSYVSALSSLTGLNVMLSTPQISIDMVGAILSYPATVFGAMGDKLLYIAETFQSGDNDIKSHLLIMPDTSSLNTIMKSLGVL